MEEEARRANGVGEQDRVRCEDPTPPAVQPYVTSNKEIPDQFMRPLLRSKVRVRAQLDVCLKPILRRGRTRRGTVGRGAARQGVAQRGEAQAGKCRTRRGIEQLCGRDGSGPGSGRRDS